MASRRLVAVALLVAGVAGCKERLSPLVGVWSADLSSVMEGAKAHADQLPPGVSEMSITFEFRADGSVSYDARVPPREERGEGHWEILRVDGDHLEVRTRLRKGDREEIKTATVVFTGPDTCTITDSSHGDIRPLVLHRKR